MKWHALRHENAEAGGLQCKIWTVAPDLDRRRLKRLDSFDFECTICMDAPRDVLLVHSCENTGHQAACLKCAQQIMQDDRQCPICCQALAFAVRQTEVVPVDNTSQKCLVCKENYRNCALVHEEEVCGAAGGSPLKSSETADTKHFGHVSCCLACGLKIKAGDGECPVCQKPVCAVVEIFPV
jgi:hypothetical protein